MNARSCFASALALPSILGVFFISSTESEAAPPGWWSTIGKEVLTGTSSLHYGAANQGQLKNIATGAYEHLLCTIPPELGGIGALTSPPSSAQPEGPANRAGTGWRLLTLIKQWVVVDHNFTSGSGKIFRQVIGQPPGAYTTSADGPRQLTAAGTQNNFAAVNQGQLKAVAAPFYARLDEVYYPYVYPKPWTGVNTLHYAIANQGQLKHMFSFDLNRDSDGDGKTDRQELLARDHDDLRSPTNPFNPDTDGDGIPDSQEADGEGTITNNPAVKLTVFGFVKP